MSENLKKAINALQGGIAAYDYHTGTFSFRFCSENMEQLLGFSCSCSGETTDDIYVIGKETYHLLYAKEQKKIFSKEESQTGRKCYQILYGTSEPCPSCTLTGQPLSPDSNEMTYEKDGHFFHTRVQEMDWNGTPAYVKFVRDVTEEVNRRKQKERLEQYFQTVVKYLPGGMAVVRHKVGGEIKPEYLSDGFSEMLDMDKKEAWKMYQEDALAGVHPEDKEMIRKSLELCIREKREKYELQYRLKKGNGDYIWVNVKFSVIQCEGGDARVYADYHDITAEKKMQEQLRKQYKERIFQHYLLAGPDALILGHCNITQNRILEIVDHTDSDLLERFGDDREDFFKGIGTLIVDEAERKEFYSRFLNEPSQQAFFHGIKEVVYPCFIEAPREKTGKYVQFKVTLVETPDTGDITGILTVTDITEKTIHEKIFLKLSSTNYDLVADVNLLSDTYEIVSGGDERINERRGKNSQRIHKVIEEMVIQNPREKEYVSDMLNPEAMLRRLREQNSYSFAYSIRDEKGEIRTKKMSVLAIDLRLGRVCFIRADVTDVLLAERKVKDELERALAEAEKASRVKSDFLSSMSHDIRTPMNAIVGMTTLALANLNDQVKIQDDLNKISVSSQHLLSLINDILDMSQIEQSKLHLNVQTMQVQELVDHISSIMTAQAEHAGLKFCIETGELKQVRFSGDELRLKQILINLLSNSFKFTMEGGTVLFRTEELPARKPGRVRYCFTVADSGIGMSQDFLEHLFEPFTRSQKVTRVEGSGLGLSITKCLVDMMYGEIRVTSKVMKGTRFEVELEFDRVEEIEEKQVADPQGTTREDLSGYHFLLVEDNEINSEILGEILQMWGATFAVKTDGLQAVNEFMQTEPGTYDAIFMDVQMPVMNGYEATKKIRSLDRPDARSILILAMTANAFARDVQAAREAGMDGHIAKPVDMKLLYRTISTMLKKNSISEEKRPKEKEK